jgi:small conductance mechanosensitive channel
LAQFEDAGIEMPEPTYRLIGADAPATPSKAPSSAAPKTSAKSKAKALAAKPTPPLAVKEVAPDQDTALDRIIAQERDALKGDDLLKSNGLEE